MIKAKLKNIKDLERFSIEYQFDEPEPFQFEELEEEIILYRELSDASRRQMYYLLITKEMELKLYSKHLSGEEFAINLDLTDLAILSTLFLKYIN